MLGSRGDVLPDALVAPLRSLHDRVPARPFEKLRKHVEQQLAIADAEHADEPATNDAREPVSRATWRGRTDGTRSSRRGRSRRAVSEVFSSIEPEAIAAASLAQVHKATLRDGTTVAVKIQYPEARRLFPIDLGSLRRAVKVTRWLNRSLDFRPLVTELHHFVLLELQFSRELVSTKRVRENLQSDPKIVVPLIYDAYSTDQMLVLEFITGTALSRAASLRERGVDLRDIAKRVAELYARMIFTHGFFHGDPHPGNILVLDDGRIALLDFGLAKELPEGFAGNAARMIAAGMSGDTAKAVEAARAIGFVVSDAKAPHLITLIKALLGDYEQAGDLLKQLAPGELEIPHHFTLIGRVMIILSGVSHTLVPNERIIGGALLAALAPHMMAARSAS
ncbi:MAG: AarF/ABC1/UbiB kinase family protein [Deltaproteobacteria bacterium]|nr:AarF/ABC1/UbiB kinase family protein [Deltaproteobacteria bacterium]